MFSEVSIDKDSETPAYRQIIEIITNFINLGKLLPGDRLPSEREMAEKFDVARGTIKKAYEKLSHNNILEIIHGRGTFVSFRQNVIGEGRKEQALSLIKDFLSGLEQLSFSYREIKNLVDLEIMAREERREFFSIAVVDCNPESLQLFEKQLGYIAQVRVIKLLLDDLAGENKPQEKLRPFQIIVTTSTHYSELLGMLQGLREKIIQVVLSPSQGSIIELAKITPSQDIGIICQSRNYLRLIRRRLRDFQISSKKVHHLFLKGNVDLKEFIADKNVIIVPAHFKLPWNQDSMNALQLFRQKGGRYIEFNYQIERGSLLHLEERIKELLQQKS